MCAYIYIFYLIEEQPHGHPQIDGQPLDVGEVVRAQIDRVGGPAGEPSQTASVLLREYTHKISKKICKIDIYTCIYMHIYIKCTL